MPGGRSRFSLFLRFNTLVVVVLCKNGSYTIRQRNKTKIKFERNSDIILK